MSHGGSPEAGTNPFVGIDGTALTITSPSGPDAGLFAPWLASLDLTYEVTYTFAGLGNPNGTTKTVTKHIALRPGSGS